MKFDQDLCWNSYYDLKKLLWQAGLNPRVRCAFGNVSNIIPWSDMNSVGARFTKMIDKKIMGTSKNPDEENVRDC